MASKNKNFPYRGFTLLDKIDARDITRADLETLVLEHNRCVDRLTGQKEVV